LKNGVFWVVTPCGSCKNRRFGGTWRLFYQGDKIGELGTTQAVTINRLATKYFFFPEDTILHCCPIINDTMISVILRTKSIFLTPVSDVLLELVQTCISVANMKK
jgi:hypothetical protein